MSKHYWSGIGDEEARTYLERLVPAGKNGAKPAGDLALILQAVNSLKEEVEILRKEISRLRLRS